MKFAVDPMESVCLRERTRLKWQILDKSRAITLMCLGQMTGYWTWSRYYGHTHFDEVWWRSDGNAWANICDRRTDRRTEWCTAICVQHYNVVGDIITRTTSLILVSPQCYQIRKTNPQSKSYDCFVEVQLGDLPNGVFRAAGGERMWCSWNTVVFYCCRNFKILTLQAVTNTYT